MKKLELQLQEASAALGSKVDAKDFEDVKDLLVKLPKVSEVQEWKRTMDGNLKKFSSQGSAYAEEFRVQNEILRRYDEVLT